MARKKPKQRYDKKKLEKLLSKSSNLTPDSQKKRAQFKEWLARASKVGPDDFNLRLR
jgi:hypothetical protein